MSVLRWLSDFVGTGKDFFRIGFTGVRLKNSSGILEIRNAGDTGDTPIKAYDRIHQEAFTQATSSPITIVTPTNGEIVRKVIVEVTTAGAAGSPTISVGVAGTVEAYMAAAENNLKEVGVYEVEPMVSNAASAIIATIVVSAQTFVGKVTVVFGLPG